MLTHLQSSASETYFDSSLDRNFKIFSYKDIWVSDTPTCRQKDCQAVMLIEKNSSIAPKISHKVGGNNPASVVCNSIHGEPKIFSASNKNEVSICKFPDGSFLNTWSYINSFNGKK